MKILDLTLTISDSIPTFPGSPAPSFIPWENLKDDGYNLELLFLTLIIVTDLDFWERFWSCSWGPLWRAR